MNPPAYHTDKTLYLILTTAKGDQPYFATLEGFSTDPRFHRDTILPELVPVVVRNWEHHDLTAPYWRVLTMRLDDGQPALLLLDTHHRQNTAEAARQKRINRGTMGSGRLPLTQQRVFARHELSAELIYTDNPLGCIAVGRCTP